MEASYSELESYLKAIAHANRLELLEALTTPRTLDEIRLRPTAAVGLGSAERTMSRQGVQNHLNKLIDAGIVRVSTTDRKGKRGIQEYHLESARLFALTEELRRLTRLPPSDGIDPMATQQLSKPADTAWKEGPKLVLVHGVREGRAFGLPRRESDALRGWIIGRSANADVRLEYDPFVSLENAEIVQRGSSFALLDVRSARNGTFLNWKRLPPGGEVPLESGDVVGVGRTLLVFRPR